MRNLCLTIAGALFLSASAFAQSKFTFEQYSFLGAGQNSLLAPVAHFQTNSKWYAEARYNYEDIETFSLYAGRTFSADKDFSWSLTPIIGGIAGRMKGASAGLNSDCSYKNFFLSSQAQYSVSADTRYDNFFYNWSEIGYQPLQWAYAGIAFQHTRLYATNSIVDPGLMVGLSFNQWTFPLYSFNPFSEGRYFVLGINWEWKHKQKKNLPFNIPSLTSTDSRPLQ